MEENKYGKLLTPSIKLHRQYFRELVSLLGIQVIYRAPKPDRHWTTYAEVESNYEQPLSTGCIFTEHPKQQTMNKLGWLSELQDEPSLIHVDYDLPGLKTDALFVIPSGLDGAPGRLFRVRRLSNSIVYPASMTCLIVPEFENTFSNSSYNYKHSDFNLLSGEDDHL